MDFGYKKNKGSVLGRAQIFAYLDGLGDGEYLISVKKYRKESSKKQKAVWWIWMRKLVRDMPFEYGDKVLSAYLLQLHGSGFETGPDGIPRNLSITENDTEEQNLLHERVRLWAFQWHGIRLDYLEET